MVLFLKMGRARELKVEGLNDCQATLIFLRLLPSTCESFCAVSLVLRVRFLFLEYNTVWLALRNIQFFVHSIQPILIDQSTKQQPSTDIIHQERNTTMLAPISNPLLFALILLTSQQPTSAEAHALPIPANQQPLLRQQHLQPQPPPHPTSIPSFSSGSQPDLTRITRHTTLTLYTATKTITVPNTRDAMQTSMSSFAEDSGEGYEVGEVDECDPAACAGCRAWYLCPADLGVEW
jgi:hypothetical protein